MPRRKPVSETQTQEPTIPLQMLPPARPTIHREHPKDPYETLPGAVALRSVTREPAKPTPERLKKRDAAQVEAQARANRYLDYLDARAKYGENVVAALAEVYKITEEEARLHRAELMADVRSGLPVSSVGDLLEKHDLGMQARIARYSQHVYSDNPAASLNALKQLQDLEGGGTDLGSFESYLRQVKEQKRK